MPPWGGGILQEAKFLNVRFQKAVGNAPSKSCFDFGRRTCRLCAIEASFFQKQFQHFFGIHGIYFPFVPVFSLGDLRIQDRAILPDQFSFFLSDFLDYVPAAFFSGIVKYTKLHRVSFSLSLSQETILAFRAGLDSNIVGRNSLQHILAFSYVNDLIVQFDAVNAWVFVFA